MQISLKEQIIAFVIMLGLCLIITGDYLLQYSTHEEIANGILATGDMHYYFDRECNEDIISGSNTSLEYRKQMRWVWKSVELTTYKYINNAFGSGVLSRFHRIFYSVFLFLTFLFIVKTNFSLMAQKSKKHFYYMFLAYAFFMFFTIGVKSSGEFYFSVVECFCISAAIYAVIKRNILLYLFVIGLATLNRETGILIATFWFLFYSKDYKAYVFGFVAPLLLFLVNLDVISCMIRPDYILSVRPQAGQTILWDPTSYSIQSILLVLFRNYFIFLIPVIYLRKYFTTLVTKRLLLIFLGYLVVFLLGAALEHMASKFMLAPIVITLCVQALFFAESSHKEHRHVEA